MIRLLALEWRRFFARRLTRLLAVAVLLGIAAAGIGLAVNSDRDVAGARARAQRTAAQFLQEDQAARAQCLAHAPPDQAENMCGPAGPQQLAASLYDDPRFSFHDHLRDLVRAGVLIGAMIVLLASASFIGAEWQAGTFATLLTWEPRRHRVLGAKLLAALAGSVTLAAAGIGLLVGTAALVAATRGTMGTVQAAEQVQAAHFTSQTLAMAGRGLGLVALAGVLGAGLAALFRSTVAALGVVIGYLVIGEAVLGGLLRHGDLRNHLLIAHATALLNGSYRWMAPSRTPGDGLEFSSGHPHVLHALGSGLLLAALAAALVAVAVGVLQRRDVT